MSELFAWACVAQLAIASVLFLRLARGPTVSDRIVALNALATIATVVVIFFAATTSRTVYLDVALWLCSFSYLATIVWSRYLERELL